MSDEIPYPETGRLEEGLVFRIRRIRQSCPKRFHAGERNVDILVVSQRI